MLSRNSSLLIVTDIQGRLASLMDERESLYHNAGILIEGIKILGIPILWVEQYPEGLGPTVTEIASRLEGLSPPAQTGFLRPTRSRHPRGDRKPAPIPDHPHRHRDSHLHLPDFPGTPRHGEQGVCSRGRRILPHRP